MCERLVETISRIKKWSEFGRQSILNDAVYLRKRVMASIGTESKMLIISFDLLEKYIEIYMPSKYSKEQLLEFVK